ncbi:hypothetical protein [Parasphingorhabdus sp.]|uniref:hypothetical protein n=1 Tax=Parasphingorhabdus sp. TaxID=2709688 RepID=UPI003A955BF9
MNFEQQRAAALAILSSNMKASRKCGSFLGQCAVDDTPLTERQERWFGQLVEKAGIELEAAQ